MKILKELKKSIDRQTTIKRTINVNYKEESRKIRKLICQSEN